MEVKNFLMERGEIHDLKLKNNAALDALIAEKNKAAAAGGSENNDFELSGRMQLKEQLDRLAHIAPEEAPEVRKLVIVYSEKYRAVPPETMYQVAFNVAEGILPWGCTMGTLIEHHEYTKTVNGKRVTIIAHQEVFVRLPQGDSGKDFDREISAALTERLQKDFGIEPELEVPESLAHREHEELLQLTQEILKKMGAVEKKGIKKIFKEYVEVHADLEKSIEQLDRKINQLIREAATFPEQLKALYVAQRELQREREELAWEKVKLEEKARAMAQEWYKEHAEKTWEDCQLEKENFAEDVLNEIRKYVEPGSFKAILTFIRNRLEYRDHVDD